MGRGSTYRHDYFLLLDVDDADMPWWARFVDDDGNPLGEPEWLDYEWDGFLEQVRDCFDATEASGYRGREAYRIGQGEGFDLCYDHSGGLSCIYAEIPEWDGYGGDEGEVEHEAEKPEIEWRIALGFGKLIETFKDSGMFHYPTSAWTSREVTPGVLPFKLRYQMPQEVAA